MEISFLELFCKHLFLVWLLFTAIHSVVKGYNEPSRRVVDYWMAVGCLSLFTIQCGDVTWRPQGQPTLVLVLSGVAACVIGVAGLIGARSNRKEEAQEQPSRIILGD